jgi:hypothetical protein
MKDECKEDYPQLFSNQSSEVRIEKVKVPGIEISVHNNFGASTFSKKKRLVNTREGE